MNSFFVILIGFALLFFMISFFSNRIDDYIISSVRKYLIRRTAIMTFACFFGLVIGVFLLCIYATTGIVYLMIFLYVLGRSRRIQAWRFRTIRYGTIRRRKNQTPKSR